MKNTFKPAAAVMTAVTIASTSMMGCAGAKARVATMKQNMQEYREESARRQGIKDEQKAVMSTPAFDVMRIRDPKTKTFVQITTNRCAPGQTEDLVMGYVVDAGDKAPQAVLVGNKPEAWSDLQKLKLSQPISGPSKSEIKSKNFQNYATGVGAILGGVGAAGFGLNYQPSKTYITTSGGTNAGGNSGAVSSAAPVQNGGTMESTISPTTTSAGGAVEAGAVQNTVSPTATIETGAVQNTVSPTNQYTPSTTNEYVPTSTSTYAPTNTSTFAPTNTATVQNNPTMTNAAQVSGTVSGEYANNPTMTNANNNADTTNVATGVSVSNTAAAGAQAVQVPVRPQGGHQGGYEGPSCDRR